MATNLEYDPSKVHCPDFASADYDFMRVALIGDVNSPDITTDEQAAQRLASQWLATNRALRDRYQAEQQQIQALEEQRAQEAADAERKRLEEEKQDEEEKAKELERKKAPLFRFQQGASIQSIPPPIHPYAKKLITMRKYVPLWYFTLDARLEGKRFTSESIDNSRLLLSPDDEDSNNPSLKLVGSHTARASPNAVPDSHLPWAQIFRAKNGFLDALKLGNYPNEFIAMFAGFYTNMDMHREMDEVDGERVMAHYHNEMRIAWYDAMDRGKPFDLAVISENVSTQTLTDFNTHSSLSQLAEC
ncbi:hypothetical protein F5878DRAFT_608374 [Lentinula raphanica]|uniref:Uncharacterized protein n=1 Tax=Lentinula raphanica TaxID=153919 RepID=A0AA38PGB0_9AGAR|nr:hypothetical protein F5878DRAFT_608374 [Lentinula raphanica]